MQLRLCFLSNSAGNINKYMSEFYVGSKLTKNKSTSNSPFFTGLCSEREVSDAPLVTSTVH